MRRVRERVMGSKSRRKGNRVELELLHLLQDAGLAATKHSRAWTPGHDLNLPMLGVSRRVEIKCKANGFRTLYSWLIEKDLLIVRADRSKPLVVMPMDMLLELIAATDKINTSDIPEAGEEFFKKAKLRRPK